MKKVELKKIKTKVVAVAEKKLKATTAVGKKLKAARKLRLKANSVKRKRGKIRRVLQIGVLDKELLAITTKPYEDMLDKLTEGKRILDADRKLIVDIGRKILQRAKDVRQSLLNNNKK